MTKFVKLGDLIETRGGGTPSKKNPEYWNGSIPWASVKDLKDVFLSKTQDFITQQGVDNSSTNIIPSHTVIVATRMVVGKACINTIPVAINQDLRAIFCSDRLFFKYLFWFLKASVHQLENLSSGATVKGITIDAIKNLLIPLPPIAEQKRIAAILDKADGVRRKRREAIRLTEELARSLFLDMFGDPVTNPKGWDVVKLEDLLDFMTSGSRGWAKYYTNEGELFLRIQNVKNGRLLLNDVAYVNAPDSAETKRIRVRENDVLLSMTADLGRTAVIPCNFPTAYINQHLSILRLKLNKVEPRYLAFFLSSMGGKIQIDALNRQGVKAGLNFDDVKSLKILLPPFQLQKRYALLFEKNEKLINDHKHRFSLMENLFNSLLQRAFRGDL